MNIETALKEPVNIANTLGGDQRQGLGLAAAGNTEVVKTKLRTMVPLSLNDAIKDILITLSKQHIFPIADFRYPA